ncbi:RNA recognition motif domain-containing protein [Thalassomonas sp. M1454]|uniref:RNA recognition motif domain-containing protein n=1 Tax=Thalassomonas sp. M1454 TaxID=2594477 RepID=UPI0011802A91|nr:RNA-binding protein [Thalassomonas sp. M1454]TRX56437.1 RNA-binding protein [Thalassomonas sp. M1454]
MKILVRNLARTTQEHQIRAMFAAHGTVQSCTLVMDTLQGTSKGFGFVEMPNPGEAKAAIKTLNESNVDGKKIRVKVAEEKKQVREA